MTSRELIEQLALNDPIVAAHLAIHRRGQTTWVECIETLVVHLAQANAGLVRQLTKLVENGPSPHVIVLKERETAEFEKLYNGTFAPFERVCGDDHEAWQCNEDCVDRARRAERKGRSR